MCDVSNFGNGAALLQSHKGTSKMNLISVISRLFTQAEDSLHLRENLQPIYTLSQNMNF